MTWMPASGVLVSNGKAARFSLLEAATLDLLWKNRGHDERVTAERMMLVLYGADGGPESLATIRVRVCHMRQKLEPLGLGIDARNGYHLVSIH